MNLIKLEKENISIKTLIGLISLAYIFSVAIRMIWVYQFNGTDAFMWNNELMVNTNDGYYFATAVKNFLFDTNTYNNQLSTSIRDYPGVVYATWLLTKITPFSLDTIILYMPAFISSLVVIPIILLMRLFNKTLLGFFAALIGSIAWSYYNRTMVGYYDSDMFAVLMQFMVLFSLISILVKQSITNILYASILIIIYPLFYPQGLSLIYAMFLLLSIYLLVFNRKCNITYISITILSVSLINIVFYLKLIIVLAMFIFLKKKILPFKLYIYLSILGAIIFLTGSNISGLIISKFSMYLDRGVQEEGLKFFQVIQTVREAGQIPFETMANRISGSTIGVIASLIGYILLVIKYRPFILALPLIGIGIFSLWGGLRFTVYAVPIAAMGSVFLFYVIASFAENKIARYSMIIVLTAAMLFPNIKHIVNYKVPTVFTKNEVKILDKLKTISSPKDYTLTWWDYGYPIWYYSNTNTLIDGGKHNQDNFIISQILNTDSQTQAANLSRLAVETYVSSGYKIVANEIFKNKQKDQIDPNMMLDELMMDDYKLPQKTRDIFLYLPSRMLNIFPTVGVFSNINLKTGKEKKRPFFYQSQSIKDSGKIIDLGNNIKILQDTGEIQIGTQKVKIANLAITYYDNKGKLQKNIQRLNKNSPISVIYMKSYNKFLIVDKNIYNSLFIQMFVLENYDKELFEAVILNPLAKVYKLKI
ncbi:MAG: STT3 domain-containing protein [Campylobacterota bacterium]|nr:STT3 domain-containing protein [Campylobacterota bacterium]